MVCKLKDNNKVYIFNHWINVKEKNIYVFVGKNGTTLKEKEFKDNKTNNVTFINEFINEIDTIHTIKNKIKMYINNDYDYDDLYLWCLKKVTLSDINIFVRKVFKKKKIVSSTTLQSYFTTYFNNKNLFPDDEYSKELVHQILVDNVKTIKSSLTFDLVDDLFSINPFIVLKNKTYDNIQYDFQHYYLLNHFNPINNEINFVDNNTITNKLYFPKSDIKITNVTKSLIEKTDNMLNINDTSLISTMKCKIQLLHFKVLPISFDLSLSLKTIFNLLHTSDDIPFIMLRTKYTNFFKFNKNAIGKFSEKQIELINDKFKKQKDISRTVESILIQIRFNENVNFYMTLFSNGRYNIKYSFMKTEEFNIDDIYKSFNKINDITTIIDSSLYHLTKDTNIFTEQNIEILDFNSRNKFIFNKKISNVNEIIKKIENNPLIEYVDKQDKMISIKYKRVNNYIDSDDVTTYIHKNINAPYENIIKGLQKEFELSETDAKEEYEMKKNNVEIKYLKAKNIFLVKKTNTAILCRLFVDNNMTLRIYCSNISDYNNEQHCLKLLTSMVSTNQKYKNITKNEKETLEEQYKLKPEQADKNKTKINKMKKPLFQESLDLISDDEDEFEDDDEDDEDDEDNKEDEILQPIVEETKPADTKKPLKGSIHETFVLKKLEEADPQLFTWSKKGKSNNYSTRCQANYYKQPIVINKKEKEYIDKNYPKSYDGYVKTGSTETKINEYYYICPKIWCKFARVSLSDKDLKKLDGICPDDDEPMFFPPKDKPYHGEPRRPYFLKESIHPEKSKYPDSDLYLLPCCGKKIKPETKFNDKKSVVEGKKTDNRYISVIEDHIILEQGKYGTLPKQFNLIMDNKENCVGNIDMKSNCVVRTGVLNTKESFLESLSIIFGINDMKTHILKNLKPEHYVLLNGGYTLKTYFNKDSLNNFKKEYKNLKEWFENKKYVEMFNLKNVKQKYETFLKKDFEYDDIPNEIKREFIIYKSYLNFMTFIQSNIPKTEYDIYHLTTYDWFNPKQKTVLITEKYNDSIFITNPKYFDINKYIDIGKEFNVLFKINDHYEYLSKLSSKVLYKNTSFDYVKIKPLVDRLLNEKIESDVSLKSIEDNKIDVKYYIIDYNFKCCGVITSDKNFIPLSKYEHLIFNEKLKIKYISSISSFKSDKDLLLKVGHKIKNSSDNHIELENSLYDICDSNEFIENMLIFISHKDIEDDEYYKKLYEKILEIEEDKELMGNMYYIKHDMNPLSRDYKIDLIKELTNVNDKMALDMLLKPFEYIKNNYINNNPIKKEDEIILNFENILNDDLLKLHKRYQNKYKIIDTSIEDFVNSKLKITKIKQKNEIDKFKIHPKSLNITPVRIQKMLANFLIEDLVNTNQRIIDIFIFVSKISSKNEFNDEIFRKILNEKIEKLFASNKLLREYELNPSFEYNKIKGDILEDFINLINLETYSFGYFELKVIGEYLNINICIIGRKNNTKIPNGVLIFNVKSDRYVIFHYNYNSDLNKDDFKLVYNENNIVHSTDDLSDDFIKLLDISKA